MHPNAQKVCPLLLLMDDCRETPSEPDGSIPAPLHFCQAVPWGLPRPLVVTQGDHRCDVQR